MTKSKLVLILALPVALVLFSTCSPVRPAISPPIKTPTPTPDPPPADAVGTTSVPLSPTDPPNSTATLQPANEFRAVAWTSLARPGWGSVQTVSARLTQGGRGVASARMYSIVHDKDADRRWPSEGFETTGEDGIASVSFIVVDAPADYIVHIDVYLVYEGITYQTGASFAPQC